MNDGRPPDTAPEFFVTGGTLRHDAPSYVERQADRELYEGLRQGEFCYVLTPRQMGKSSLMVRTASRLREQGIRAIALDLTAIGQNVTPEQWYGGLVLRLGQQLKLEDGLEDFWNHQPLLGPVQRLIRALRDVVLTHLQGPLVVFVDELDVVRSLPFSTDEFFAAIRECYHRRTEDAVFGRLTFCLLGVAMPADLIRDTRITPFNIGKRIELNDFTHEEAVPLTKGLEVSAARCAQPRRLLERILYWTGGHPYLTQRLCRAVAESFSHPGSSAGRLDSRRLIDSLCEDLFFSGRARERDDNLIFVRERLLRSEGDRAGLLDLYLKVRNGKRVPDEETNPLVGILRLSGIVQAQRGWLKERNRIYVRVFDRAWVMANLPDADLRRQREAFRRGVIRTTAIAAVVVGAMGIMVVMAFTQRTRAQWAEANAYVSQAEAKLVSGLQGQRFESLRAIVRAAPVFPGKDKLRRVAIASMALMDLQTIHRTNGWPVGTSSAALNGDFSLLAQGDRQGIIRVRNLANDDREIARLPGSGAAVEWLQFSPNSHYLAAKSPRGATLVLEVWDWRMRPPTRIFSHEATGRAFDFSPDNRRWAMSLADGRIQILELDTGRIIATLPPQLSTRFPRRSNCIRFHPVKNQLAESCDTSLNLQVWDLERGQVISSLFHPSPVLHLDWHPQGELLAAACKNGDIYLGEVHAGQKPSKILTGHDSHVVQVAFSHQGDVLASHGADHTLRLWIPSTGRLVTGLLETDHIDTLQFSLDDRYLGFGRVEADMEYWEVNLGREYRVLLDRTPPGEEWENLEFSPDGRVLAAASDEGLVLWDPAAGKKLGAVPKVTTQSVSFHPLLGDLMASSSYGLHRWSFRPLDRPNEAHLQLKPVADAKLPAELGQLAVAANGKTAAVIHQAEICLFNPDGATNYTLLPTETYYQSLALNPDGRFLAARTKAGNDIHLWDLTQRARISLPTPIQGGPCFAFSPDGQWLVTSSPEACYFWRVGAWRQEFNLGRQRSGQPGPVAFTGNGRIFAMAVSPSGIELFAPPSREPLARLDSPDRRPLVGLAFTRDGRRLAAACAGKMIQVWDLALISQGLANLNLQGGLPTYPISNPSLPARDLEIQPDESQIE